MTRSDLELLQEAALHFGFVNTYADDGELDQKTIDAISLRISAGIEVLNRLAPAKRAELFGDNWSLMWGMRNRIAHGYLLVSAERIRETVARDLPQIVATLDRELTSATTGTEISEG